MEGGAPINVTLLEDIKSNSAILIELVNAKYLNMSICVKAVGSQDTSYDVTQARLRGRGAGQLGAEWDMIFVFVILIMVILTH